MEKLSTIQKRGNLNEVVCNDEPHEINKGHHSYTIVQKDDHDVVGIINFQNGPRNVDGSIPGVLDVDLLEIVRHRLQSFQSGPYATRENAIALTKLEEVLMWLNKRVEDRIESNKLGTNKI